MKCRKHGTEKDLYENCVDCEQEDWEEQVKAMNDYKKRYK